MIEESKEICFFNLRGSLRLFRFHLSTHYRPRLCHVVAGHGRPEMPVPCWQRLASPELYPSCRNRRQALSYATGEATKAVAASENFLATSVLSEGKLARWQ